MATPKASRPLAYYTGGGVPVSNSVTLRTDSRARLPFTLGDVLKQKTSDMNVMEETCPPCDAVSTTTRHNLINMKCRYFHSFTGCTRPDCRFLHNEKPEDVVFHDGF
eukprot:796027-Prymnesium_polylepis.1